MFCLGVLSLRVPPFWCVPFTDAHSSQVQRFSRWLVCSARVCSQFECSLFWCPFRPCTYVPSTEIPSLVGILQCTCLCSVSGVSFSGAPFTTSTRPKHRCSVDGSNLAVFMSVFSSDVTFLILHYPRLLRPKLKDSVVGWYPAVHVSLFPSSGAIFLDPLLFFSEFP